jgi:hypothetical protein
VAIHKRDDGVAEVFMRRYAAGKCFAIASGDARYAKEAEAALRDAVSLSLAFSPQRFLEVMRRSGVPDDITAAYIKTAKATDETYFKDTDGSYFKEGDF